tara:strand:+ start:668 stop:856 length:189 start_codon:yes stop_codon:yes gene_type:complete
MEAPTKQRQTNDDRTRMTLSAEPKYVPTHIAVRQKAMIENRKVASVANELMTIGARFKGLIE